MKALNRKIGRWVHKNSKLLMGLALGVAVAFPLTAIGMRSVSQKNTPLPTSNTAQSATEVAKPSSEVQTIAPTTQPSISNSTRSQAPVTSTQSQTTAAQSKAVEDKNKCSALFLAYSQILINNHWPLYLYDGNIAGFNNSVTEYRQNVSSAYNAYEISSAAIGTCLPVLSPMLPDYMNP